MMMIIEVNSVKELENCVPNVLVVLADKKKVALYGEMGAGKTTFVKAVCKFLGVRSNTASPTFSLVNEYSYQDEDGEAKIFRHLDLYRLRNANEALDIGIEDFLEDDCLCFIEWPQLVEPIFPPGNSARITIEILGPKKRRISIVS